MPNPHPLHFSHWEKGGRQAGVRVRSLVMLLGRLGVALVRFDPPASGADAKGKENQVARHGSRCEMGENRKLGIHSKTR